MFQWMPLLQSILIGNTKLYFNMKIQLKQYKYEKIEIESRDFELPTAPVYFFETGIRRSIRIVPLWTTYNKKHYNKEEEIYGFMVTCIYLSFECKIKHFQIPLRSIGELHPTSDKHRNDFITSWISNHFNERSKEMFENDLIHTLNQIAPEKLIQK